MSTTLRTGCDRRRMPPGCQDRVRAVIRPGWPGRRPAVGPRRSGRPPAPPRPGSSARRPRPRPAPRPARRRWPPAAAGRPPTTSTYSPRGATSAHRSTAPAPACRATPPRAAWSARGPRTTWRLAPRASARSASVRARRWGASYSTMVRRSAGQLDQSLRCGPIPDGAGSPRTPTARSAARCTTSAVMAAEGPGTTSTT